MEKYNLCIHHNNACIILYHDKVADNIIKCKKIVLKISEITCQNKMFMLLP